MASILLMTLISSCWMQMGTAAEGLILSQPSCNVLQQIQSPYVTPLIEKVSQVTGFLCMEMTPNFQEVHILSLSSIGSNQTYIAKTGYLPSIALHIRSRSSVRKSLDSPLVIALHSLTPVMWQLHVPHQTNTSNFHFIISKPSQLVSNPMVSLTRKKAIPLTRLKAWIQNHYGAVTSVSKVSEANKVTLLVGTDGVISKNCNFSSQENSGSAEAVYIQPQSAVGCVIEDYKVQQEDKGVTHVVELKSSVSSNSSVIIHLQPPGYDHDVGLPILQQNLVLVLKCHVAVKWLIESWGIQGVLNIVAEDAVHIHTSPSYQKSEIQYHILPSDTEELLAKVQTDFGPVSTFTKALKANRINMIIKGKILGPNTAHVQGNNQYGQSFAKKALSSISPLPPYKVPSFESQAEFDSINGKIFVTQDNKSAATLETISSETVMQKISEEKTLGVLLTKEMKLECLDDSFLVVLPFHRVMELLTPMLSKEGQMLSSVTLTDFRCRAELDESHIVLRSRWSNCGTKTITLDDSQVYYNQVLFLISKHASKSSTHFGNSGMPNYDDEDLSEIGSGYEAGTVQNKPSLGFGNVIFPLPLQCMRKTLKTSLNAPLSSPEHRVYQMNLFLDKDFQHPLLDQLFPLKVAADEHIFAETVVEADHRTCIVTDECWLSNNELLRRKNEKKRFLIKKGCPSDLTVQLLSQNACQDQRLPSLHQWQRFSFQLSEDFVNEYTYLHCRLTICASEDTDKMKLKQCMNMRAFCINQSLYPFLEIPMGKMYGMEVRGPLHVVQHLMEEDKKDLFYFGNSMDVSRLPKGQAIGSSRNGQGPTANQKPTVTQQVILLGISTEIVIGIAFASFIIGAGLMAMLWLIHLHTDPSRQSRMCRRMHCRRSHHHHSHESRCSVTSHNGNSAPSSQVSMLVHARP